MSPGGRGSRGAGLHTATCVFIADIYLCLFCLFGAPRSNLLSAGPGGVHYGEGAGAAWPRGTGKTPKRDREDPQEWPGRPPQGTGKTPKRDREDPQEWPGRPPRGTGKTPKRDREDPHEEGCSWAQGEDGGGSREETVNTEIMTSNTTSNNTDVFFL